MTVEKSAESEEKPEKNQLRAGDNVKEHAIHVQAQNAEYREASKAGQDFTSMTSLRVPSVQERMGGQKAGLTVDSVDMQPVTEVESFGIQMDDGFTVTARSKPGKGDEAPLAGSAEDTGSVVDYQWKETGQGSFALGMDYEAGATDSRTPSEKVGDFLQAAAARATDPEGWQKYLDGQVEKFIGIGEGLNIAKEHTKEAVLVGWTALTDGTVANFLSKPNAINDPLFNTIGGALDAMAQDPDAVNHALERLGTSIMQASEHFSSLPDREKGHVIGETAFFLVNPEGSTEAGEAALKIADRVATGVDKVVMDGIRASVKSAEEMAVATPELADQARRMLYDYTKRLGLTPQEMEAAGIPRGYFDGIEPPPGAGKGDQTFAMSKADDLGGDVVKGSGYRVDKAIGRLQRTDLGKPREPYNWEALNERFSSDVVRQSNRDSCISAVGEMLSEGRLTEKELIGLLSKRPDIKDLVEHLGPEWTDELRRFSSISEISEKGPWAAELMENAGTELEKSLHTVVVDGVSDSGNLVIRDPWEGTKYEMDIKHFLEDVWTGRAVYRR